MEEINLTMFMKDTISIITVTLNVENFVDDYFTAIFVGGHKPFEVLVYDGGSTDKTIELIKKYQKKYPAIKLFQGKNIGFAAGNNLLARKAVGEYLFILNPDTKIDKNCLKYLIKNEKRPTSILVPKQLTFDGKLLTFGNGIDILGCPTSGKFFADGAAIFIKRLTFKKLGEFDPDYFVFQEDVDLSWRAHLCGVSLVFDPDAFIYHFSGGTVAGGSVKDKQFITTTFRRYLGEKNIYQNLLKNYSLIILIFVLPINFIINLFEIIVFTLTGRFSLALCYPRAWWWILSHLSSIIRKRHIVQQKRIVSDWQILGKTYKGSAKLRLLFTAGLPNTRPQNHV